MEYYDIFYIIVPPIPLGVSLNLNLQSQFHWFLFNGTWQKKPRELNSRLRFEIEEMTLIVTRSIMWGTTLIPHPHKDHRCARQTRIQSSPVTLCVSHKEQHVTATTIAKHCNTCHTKSNTSLQQQLQHTATRATQRVTSATSNCNNNCNTLQQDVPRLTARKDRTCIHFIELNGIESSLVTLCASRTHSIMLDTTHIQLCKALHTSNYVRYCTHSIM